MGSSYSWAVLLQNYKISSYEEIWETVAIVFDGMHIFMASTSRM